MTPPNSQEWEDIIPRGTDGGADAGTDGRANAGTNAGTDAARAGPFAVAHPVDGYAFTREPESPELRYQRQPQAEVPAPPRREPPKRIRDQVPGHGVWQPGGPARIEQPKLQTPRHPSLAKALLSALVPLVLLAGGVYLLMRLYQ